MSWGRYAGGLLISAALLVAGLTASGVRFHLPTRTREIRVVAPPKALVEQYVLSRWLPRHASFPYSASAVCRPSRGAWVCLVRLLVRPRSSWRVWVAYNDGAPAALRSALCSWASRDVTPSLLRELAGSSGEARS